MHAAGRRFRLGLFVLAAGGMFLALLGFIVHGSLQTDRASYFILFHENVKGMVIGSKVNFQGVPIGAVKDIRFQDGKTLVEVLVDPTRANIQDLTRARLDRLLVTGQVTVELEGYGPTGRSVPPGSFLQSKEDPLHSLTGTLPAAMDQATSTLSRLESVLDRVEQLLGDENQQRVATLLDNLNLSSAKFATETLPAANALLAESRASAASFQTLVPEARAALATLSPEVTATLREVQALAGGLRGPSQTALASLRATLDDLRGLARQLKLAPDSLLFGVHRPAAPPGGAR